MLSGVQSKKSNILVVNCQINNIKATAILDTGAEESVISLKTVKNLHYRKQNTKFLLTAGNGKVPVLGTAKINIKIANLQVQAIVNVVDNLPFPAILGMKFLLKQNAVINLRDKKVTFENKNFRTSINLQDKFDKTPQLDNKQEKINTLKTVPQIQTKNSRITPPNFYSKKYKRNCLKEIINILNEQKSVNDSNKQKTCFCQKTVNQINNRISKCTIETNPVDLVSLNPETTTIYFKRIGKFANDFSVIEQKGHIININHKDTVSQETVENAFLRIKELVSKNKIQEISISIKDIENSRIDMNWLTELLTEMFNDTTIKISFFMVFFVTKWCYNGTEVNDPNAESDTMTSHNETRDEYEMEWDIFSRLFKNKQFNDKIANIKEINKDLFTMPENYSLAHCVGTDLRMGAGIASDFKSKFGKLGALSEQNQTAGGLAVLKENARFIYYLVTKNSSGEKPTFKNFCISLFKLRDHVIENKITRLAMPKIGCGLDQLNWEDVKQALGLIFRIVNCEITICNWAPQLHQSQPRIQPNNKKSQPIKVILEKDYKLQPYEKIYVKLNFSERPDSDTDYVFVLNDALHSKRRLLFQDTFNVEDLKNKMELISCNNLPMVLFKNTAIGYLRPKPELKKPTFLPLLTTITKNRNFNINENLETDYETKLKNLLMDFDDIFADDMSEIGKTHVLEHKIELTDQTPFRSKPYRVSQKERETINEQVEQMFKQGIIRPSNSNYVSPIVLVRKKGEKEKTRFCVDYRKLNTVTVKNHYPISDIESTLTYLGNSKYFSTLDLFSGFNQLPVAEDSKKYTAFITPDNGFWEYNCMPFGLCNAPSSFQQMTDIVFRGLKWKSILCYLDDIIVFSETLDEHLEKLKEVFSRLRAANLKAKTSKCFFLKEKIRVLGHIVDDKNIYPDPDNLKAVKDFPIPISKKKLQSFLGLCSYYRKFIENFSKIARPLFNLIKGSTKYHWTNDKQEAFEILKNKLIEPPVLAHFNPNVGCELRADASKEGIGVIILQETNGEMHPIAYGSRSLSKSEVNYPISDLEALSIIYGLTYFRHFIFGRKVTIVTDHHSLCYLKNSKNTTGRLARWKIKLLDFDCEIIYKSGKKHLDVDCLSRNPAKDAPEESEELFDVPTFALQTLNLKAEQRKDRSIVELIRAMDENDNSTSVGLRRRAKNFRLIDGVVYKKNASPTGNDNLLVIPKHLIHEILHDNHSLSLAGHLGMNKTYERIKNKFSWVGLEKDVEKFVRTCEICQHRKGMENKKPQGLLQPVEVGLPFEKVGIDILGPFPISNLANKVIVVATDYATRYVIAAALPDSKSDTVAKFIVNDIICKHGCFKILHSDRGTNFRSELIQELLKLLSIHHTYTSAYNPKCNGNVESKNAVIADMLAKLTSDNQKDWDEKLQHVIFAYNSSTHATTKFSPFFLVHGREAIFPAEASLLQTQQNKTVQEVREQVLTARNLAVENIYNRQKTDKENYDKNRRHVDFDIGEQVKVFYPLRKVGKSEKLLSKWKGPYFIERKIGEVNYEVRKGINQNSAKEIVHVARILPYYEPYLPYLPDVEEETE